MIGVSETMVRGSCGNKTVIGVAVIGYKVSPRTLGEKSVQIDDISIGIEGLKSGVADIDF